MKKVIELLEQAKLDLIKFSRDHSKVGLAMSALSNIEEVLYDLRVRPRWETPDQWEKRTGEAWKGAVYFNLLRKRDGRSVYIGDKYQTCSIEEAREIIDNLENKQNCHDYTPIIICANSDSGKPPDGWRPEKETK
jgi:hypothetical protein